MYDCPEPLEKIFQQVEEESERRAQEDVTNGQIDVSELADRAGSSTMRKGKSRRRGSISITRFGQFAQDSTKGSQRPPTPNGLVTIASQTAFYRAQATNESTNSFVSGDSTHLDGDNAHTEDQNHVTQMHQIVGRQSISRTVGGLLPRKLSRARSANVIATGDVVIGVSVEEATVESTEDVETNRASVHAVGGLRNQSSRLTMSGSSPAQRSWVSKAKGFTQKFRRKK